MIALNSLFSKLKEINNGKRGGDKIKISDKNGNPLDFDRSKAKLFIKLLEQKTGWKYLDTNWHWGKYIILSFQKGIIKPSQGRSNELMLKNPLSLAITSGTTLEYTLDKNNLFLK